MPPPPSLHHHIVRLLTMNIAQFQHNFWISMEPVRVKYTKTCADEHYVAALIYMNMNGIRVHG